MDDLQIANTILQQCTKGALMTVGAHDFRAIEGGGLLFKARLHGFLPDGTRAERATTHVIEIVLNHHDYYDVEVIGLSMDEAGEKTLRVHWEGGDLDCSQLAPLLVVLDWNGGTPDNPLNPNYFP